MNELDPQREVVERVKGELDREQRLLRLEKRVSIGLVALLALGAIQLVVATRTFLALRRVSANSVRAGEFILMDHEGRKRGSFELSGGSPRLSLLGEDGELVDVSIDRQGARVSLEDRAAGTFFSLSTDFGLTMESSPNPTPPSTIRPRRTFSVGFLGPAGGPGSTASSPRLGLSTQGSEALESSAVLSFDREGPYLEFRDGAGNVLHRQP